MLNKLLPKSLVGQISLIMLLGVLLIFSVSMQLYSGERQRVLDFISSDSALERVSSLITILHNTPVELHPDIISASQGRGFYLSLDRKALVDDNDLSPLTQKLKRSISVSEIEDVRVVSAEIKRSKRKPEIRHRHESVRAKMKKRARFNLKLTGSIQLADQRWLNFSSAVDEEGTHLPVKTILLAIIFTLLILVTMAWIVKRALKPIKNLAGVAKKVGSERDFKHIEETGPSEVLPAISAFNQMQNNLSAFIDDRSKMLAAISHDLRTPITSLRLRLEFIEEGEDKQRMLVTINQMEKMLKATLDFAKNESQKEAKQNVELHSLITTICDDYRDRGVDIQFCSVEKIIFRLWPVAFQRVIENLINNSLVYGKDEQGEVHISIALCLEHKGLKLSISDTGKGIDKLLFNEVIKPFVRLDDARDTQDSSVGLGLAISDSIIKAHAGTMVFNNISTGGFEVTIRLPVMVG